MKWRFSRYVGHGLRSVYQRTAIHIGPKEFVKALIRFDLLPGAGVADGRLDLAAMAHDARVAQQSDNIGFSPFRYHVRIEPLKGRAEILALSQNRDPGKPSLKPVENQFLPQGATVSFRHAPFDVMVVHI